MFEGLSEEQLPAALEALLFVTDEPVNAITLAQMLEVETSTVQEALVALSEKFEQENRGIQLLQVAGGWQLFTHPAYHELLEQYVLSWDTRKLSAAALEVLSIVAYAQPATRSRISEIRGVTSDGPLNTLIERGYVRECGVADSPGNPTLYGTTRAFLEKYGLASLKDLPPLEGFAPDEAAERLIRERLGAAPSVAVVEEAIDGSLESTVDGEVVEVVKETLVDGQAAQVEQAISDLQASVAGVVEKIDFDKLVFNTDDE